MMPVLVSIAGSIFFTAPIAQNTLFFADIFAAVFQAIVEYDVGSQCAGVGDLYGGRVPGHDDQSRDTEHAGRGGDPLCVVAGRICDDAVLSLGFWKPGYAIICATKLERSGVLQHFRLEQKTPAEAFVQ